VLAASLFCCPSLNCPSCSTLDQELNIRIWKHHGAHLAGERLSLKPCVSHIPPSRSGKSGDRCSICLWKTSKAPEFTRNPSACEVQPPTHTFPTSLETRQRTEGTKRQGDHQGHIHGKLQLPGLPSLWGKGGKVEVAFLKQQTDGMNMGF